MIYIGSDHGGFELKEFLKNNLSDFAIEDLGTNNLDSVNYPDYAEVVAKKVLSDQSSFGILICGTGIGMSIAANKIDGIRAALATNEFMAQMAKEHNNANILVLAGRVLKNEEALLMVKKFINSTFMGGRHKTRLDLIEKLEKKR